MKTSFQLGNSANSTAVRTTLLHWCSSSETLERIRPVSAGNGTSADGDRMQVDSLRKGKGKGKGKHQYQKGIRTNINTSNTMTNTSNTDINTCKEMDIGRRTGGDHVEELTTIQPVTTAAHRKARVARKAKGKANTWTLCKRISLMKQLQPCRILRKIRVFLENSRALHVEPWIMGVTINSVSTTFDRIPQ